MTNGRVTAAVFIEFLKRLLVNATTPIFVVVNHSLAWVELFRETIANLAARMRCNLEARMKRTAIRVEPISTHPERRRKRPIYPVIVASEIVYVSGLPPFDPETGAKT